MQSIIAILVPLLVIFIPTVFVILGLKLYLRSEQRKPVRRPFTQPFMRLPGQSLRDQIEVKREKIDANIILSMFMPLLMFSQHIYQSYFGEAQETVGRISVSIIFTMGALIYFLRLIIKNKKDLRVIELGLDGEIAVAQALEPLKRKGFFAYHDFQAKAFNIDHILVGPNGVFAVETKARSKPDRGNNKEDSQVVYDGKQLIFPNHKESASIEQAKRQAQWLNRQLSRAVGENIPVSPLLVIPGWFVELKAKSVGINITNGANLDFIARMNGGALLSEKQIKQITHQLEQKCVDDTKESK